MQKLAKEVFKAKQDILKWRRNHELKTRGGLEYNSLISFAEYKQYHNEIETELKQHGLDLKFIQPTAEHPASCCLCNRDDQFKPDEKDGDRFNPSFESALSKGLDNAIDQHPVEQLAYQIFDDNGTLHGTIYFRIFDNEVDDHSLTEWQTEAQQFFGTRKSTYEKARFYQGDELKELLDPNQTEDDSTSYRNIKDAQAGRFRFDSGWMHLELVCGIGLGVHLIKLAVLHGMRNGAYHVYLEALASPGQEKLMARYKELGFKWPAKATSRKEDTKLMVATNIRTLWETLGKAPRKPIRARGTGRSKHDPIYLSRTKRKRKVTRKSKKRRKR